MTTTINNEHKKLNVPNLRFKEFQGEWEKCKISDILSIGNGRDYKHLEKGYIPVFGTGGYMTSVNSYLYDGETAFIGRKGTINKPYYYKGKFWTVDTLFYTHSFNGVAPHFVYCLFQTINWLRYNEASGVPSLSKDTIEKIKVHIPQIEEQQKISKFLSLLDERIATQNKIIEDLKKLKSAISHILFSSKGAIHLSEIANVVMGQSPSSNAYNDQGLGMPLVQGNLDISNGKTTPRLYTAEFNQTTEKGNIILTVRAPVGEVAKATQKVCLGRGVCAIIPHEENMSDFIYQYLTFYKFMWRRYEQGSTFTSINGSDVRNIFCPKVRNVSILTLLDIKINIEERVVKQYQSQKQYMLYQMFI